MWRPRASYPELEAGCGVGAVEELARLGALGSLEFRGGVSPHKSPDIGALGVSCGVISPLNPAVRVRRSPFNSLRPRWLAARCGLDLPRKGCHVPAQNTPERFRHSPPWANPKERGSAPIPTAEPKTTESTFMDNNDTPSQSRRQTLATPRSNRPGSRKRRKDHGKKGELSVNLRGDAYELVE